MNFRDIKSESELLCNLVGEIRGNNLRVSWTWPMGSNRIVVIPVPENEDFDESAYDTYRKYFIYSSDNRNYFDDTLDSNAKVNYKYYVFTSDSFDENVLIRQNQKSNPVLCPGTMITVKYCLSKEKEKFSIGRFLKKSENDVWRLEVLSSSDLDNKDIRYRFSGEDKKNQGFCFPCTIRKNQRTVFLDIELSQNETIQLYSDKTNIKIVKVNEL